MAKKSTLSSPKPLMDELLKILVPEEQLTYFDLYEVRNKPDCYELVLHEKESCIPKAIANERGIILNGFCDPISVLSHCFSMKKVYLIFKRRRWKVSGKDTSYSNEYEIHPKGLKLTKLLVSFLKESH
jgi:hypothetical protein